MSMLIASDISSYRVCVVGLGYVGLPLAIEMAKKVSVWGFDTSLPRIEELRNGMDSSLEVAQYELAETTLSFEAEFLNCAHCNIFIITVPTPIDESGHPDLSSLIMATTLVAEHLSDGAQIIYESTVYPGCIDGVCLPLIESINPRVKNFQFSVGYSPERINPGDKDRRIANIKKVISANNERGLTVLRKLYGLIVDVGLVEASSIKVAEFSKVLENVQRDVNIALINETAVLAEKLGLNIYDVLAAARSKWNFLDFKPGLVGGHCIGIDPYYLLHAARKVKMEPHMITSGRVVNETMSDYVVYRGLRHIIKKGFVTSQIKCLVCGVTFKPNVPDLRNSKVIEVINALMDWGIVPTIVDPYVSGYEIQGQLVVEKDFLETDLYDLIYFLVPHEAFFEGKNIKMFERNLVAGSVIFDLNGDLRTYLKTDSYSSYIYL